MKILIISHEYPPIGGGGANACMHLSAEYAKLGHQVTIVTTWFQGLEREENSNGVKILRVPSKRKHKEHCGFPEMLDYVFRALVVADRLGKQERFNVCQVFFAIPSGPIGYYLKLKYKLPYIIRFGGGDIPGFQERFQLLYKLIGPFEKIIWKKADVLVANSQGLKRLASSFYDKKEIKIITNGVDAVKLPGGIKSNSSDDADKINLLFVSRLIQRKGLQFILPMLHEINESCERGVCLTIVGDGPFRSELEKIAEENQLAEIVKFQGQKDKTELPEYYQNADIFILPSQKEGMPNVVLEAMSYGIPIVMTPCEGSDELICDNGFAVPVEEFKEVLIKLCEDASLRDKMGIQSRKLVEERFLWSQIGREYLNEMKKLLYR